MIIRRFSANKKRSPKFYFMLPMLVSFLFWILLNGAAYFSGGRFLADVNLPLLEQSSIAVSGDIIVFAQKYFNRVQVYDSEANFLHGFPLRGTSSAFEVAINNAGEIIDCTPRTESDLPFDIYSIDGNLSRRAYDEEIFRHCREAQSNDVLSNGSVVSVDRNPLGYRIIVTPSEEGEPLRSEFRIFPYIIMNLLYIRVAVLMTIFLLVLELALWRLSLERVKDGDNVDTE